VNFKIILNEGEAGSVSVTFTAKQELRVNSFGFTRYCFSEDNNYVTDVLRDHGVDEHALTCLSRAGPGMSIDGIRFMLRNNPDLRLHRTLRNGRTVVLPREPNLAIPAAFTRLLLPSARQKSCSPSFSLDASGMGVGAIPHQAVICWDLPEVEGTEMRVGGYLDFRSAVSPQVAARGFNQFFAGVCRQDTFVSDERRKVQDEGSDESVKALVDAFLETTPTWVWPRILSHEPGSTTYRLTCLTTQRGAYLGWVGIHLQGAWSAMQARGQNHLEITNYLANCASRDTRNQVTHTDYTLIGQEHLPHVLPTLEGH